MRKPIIQYHAPADTVTGPAFSGGGIGAKDGGTVI